MRVLGIVLLVLIVLFGGIALYVYKELHTLTHEKITDDLHVIYALGGGNAAVLGTGEGAVIVDTMTLHSQGEAVRALAEELTGEPVVTIITSHYHLDHTHGNPAFEEGIRIISTARTRHHMEVTDAEYFADYPGYMPNETLTSRRRIAIGNKHLTLLHPGRGHTDGDLVVLFEEDRTVHLGDLFFHRRYPSVDLEAGGSMQNWPRTIDNVLYMLKFDHVIPGHGPMSDRAGLEQYKQFVSQLAQIARDAKENGTSREEVMVSDALTEDEGYEEIKLFVSIGLTRENALGRAWDEVHEAFELRE